MTIGGGDAGLYWSDVMHCPRCRSDMEQIDYQGTEVDRFTICNDIWFDTGEFEQLRNKNAAAEIDTGDKEIGRQSNTIDNYRCPRCSGAMKKMVDPDQRHTCYEACRECNGSFFDAGEFKDLSELTVSDFFQGPNCTRTKITAPHAKYLSQEWAISAGGETAQVKRRKSGASLR